MGRPKQSTLVIPSDDDPGGATPFERFDNIMKRILSAPKQEVDRRMAKYAKHRRKVKATSIKAKPPESKERSSRHAG
jgi:hypothetical protein